MTHLTLRLLLAHLTLRILLAHPTLRILLAQLTRRLPLAHHTLRLMLARLTLRLLLVQLTLRLLVHLTLKQLQAHLTHMLSLLLAHLTQATDLSQAAGPSHTQATAWSVSYSGYYWPISHSGYCWSVWLSLEPVFLLNLLTLIIWLTIRSWTVCFIMSGSGWGKTPTMGVLPLPKGVLHHGVRQNAHLCLFVFCISRTKINKIY